MKFLEQILKLLYTLIHKNDYYPFNLPDKDIYIKSILELFCKEYYDNSIIENLYKVDKEQGNDIVTSFFQSLPVKYKQIFHEIQRRQEEEYYLIHNTKKPPKDLPI